MESIMFRIMNMAELNRLEEENELLEDSQEKAVRAELRAGYGEDHGLRLSYS